MVKQMLLLRTPDGRRMAISADDIESIVEGKDKQQGRFNSDGVWHEPRPVTEINMRSGDKGKVSETFDQIVELMTQLGTDE
jgi:hypothetical protein